MPSSQVDLTIDKIVGGGTGLGRAEGKVVFVPFTAPGDRVRVRIVDEKRNFATGSVVQVLEEGPGRVQPPCPYFGRCGGCDWQHLDYPTQVSLKQSLLEEALAHRFPECGSLPIHLEPSPQPYGYRSRARIQVRRGRDRCSVGFFRHRSRAVEDVENCPLFRPLLNAALESLRAKSEEIRTEGEYELASSEETAAWAVCGATPDDERCLPHALRQGPDSRTLLRKVGDFSYRLAPSSFFQANDWLVGALALKVDDLTAGLGLQESALELYAGVGLFTLPLARRFIRVAAVESSSESSAFCRSNLKAAGLGNASVECADVLGWLRGSRPEGKASVDLVLLDPPRAGAGPDVMDAIADWNAGSVVYVACDLQTLCRDASRLRERGYRIDAVAAFDLFPQTHHFETVLRFRRLAHVRESGGDRAHGACGAS